MSTATANKLKTKDIITVSITVEKEVLSLPFIY